jgi:hypothetical protein
MEGPVGRLEGASSGRDGREGGEVNQKGVHLHARRGDLADLCHGAIRVRLGARSDDHVGAAARKGLSDVQTETAVSTGDQDSLARERAGEGCCDLSGGGPGRKDTGRGGLSGAHFWRVEVGRKRGGIGRARPR